MQNTLFDFNEPTIIDPKDKERLPLFEKTSGYDHLYILSDTKEVATLKDLASNRQLTVSTTSPSMQFYAGNFLTDDLIFEGNRQGEMHLGACFETHLIPFDFESQILKPGEVLLTTNNLYIYKIKEVTFIKVTSFILSFNH